MDARAGERRMSNERGMSNERVRRAVAYLEEGSDDLAPLEAMGLTSADLGEVLVAWGETAPRHLRTAVEGLYDGRRGEEEKAGIAVPVVVVKPKRARWRRRLALGLAVLLLVLAAALASR